MTKLRLETMSTNRSNFSTMSLLIHKHLAFGFFFGDQSYAHILLRYYLRDIQDTFVVRSISMIFGIAIHCLH